MELLNKIRRIINYIPVIWKSEEWDYRFLLILVSHKLGRMSDYYRKHGVTTSKNRISRQIQYADSLIKKIISDMYTQTEEIEHEKKYGEGILSTKEVGEHGFQSFTIIYSKCKSAEEQAEATDEMSKIVNLHHKRRKDIKRRLFNHLQKYMFTWWD